MANSNRLYRPAFRVLNLHSDTRSSIADGSIRYCGTGAWSATEGENAVFFDLPGVIKKIWIESYINGTLGSTENNILYIRKNESTDYEILSDLDLGSTYFSHRSNTAVDISLAAGDSIEIKWACPTFATNPTNVSMAFTLLYYVA